VIGDQSRAAAIGQPGAGTSTAGRTTPAAETGASAAAAARAAFPDWRFAPNIGGHPGIYEIENRALDPDGHVLAAMRNLAPWDGRVIVDLGCGTGFWLPVYAADASRVIGVEPDPALRARAAGRTSDLPAVQLLPGSAEHLPLPDRSADVVHARFAYFLTPGGDAGLAEVLRVLRPGGSLVVVDNDHHWGQFAELLAAASSSRPASGSKTIDNWWRDRGATRHAVRSEWRFASRADLRAVLRIEFPDPVTDAWLARNPVATGLTYGYVLFAVTRPGPPARDRAPASRPADLRAAGRAGS
jgi:ubiquinone/menaquinone biosynthesis C-methylase UbiE